MADYSIEREIWYVTAKRPTTKEELHFCPKVQKKKKIFTRINRTEQWAIL